MIDSKDITYGGGKYRVWIYADTDTSPTEFDCYDEATIAAWRRDYWRYVTVSVAAICGDCGDATIAPVVSLGGVEYGHLSGDGTGDDIWIDLESIIESDYMSYQEHGSGEQITVTMIDGLIDEIKKGA